MAGYASTVHENLSKHLTIKLTLRLKIHDCMHNSNRIMLLKLWK